MAVDKINSLVSDKAFTDQEKLATALRGNVELMKEAIATAATLNTTLGRSATPRDFVDNQTRAARALGDVDAASRRVAATEAQLQRQRERDEATATRREQAQAERDGRQRARLLEQAGAYGILKLRLEEATKAAQNIGAAFGADSQQFTRATAGVTALRTQIEAIERPLGNFRRNVGNYASGFNSFGNSVQQIGRELPALAINFQTFALAISNNLPIFFDEISKLSAANKAARIESQAAAVAAREQAVATALAAGAIESEAVAQGELAAATAAATAAQGTQSVGRALLSSIFSIQTALTVGITLFVLYGKEIANFVKALFNGKEALDQYVGTLKSLNEVNKKANADAAQQATNLRILYTAATDVTNSTEARLRAVRELQKEFPNTFANIKTETILNGGAKGSYDLLTDSIYKNAIAKASAAKISEQAARVLDAEFQKQKIQNANLNELDRLNEERAKRQAELAASPRISAAQLRLNTTQPGRNIAAESALDAVDGRLIASNDRAKAALKAQEDIIADAKRQIEIFTKLGGGNNALADAIAGGDKADKEQKDTTLKDTISDINKLIDAEKIRNQLVQEDDRSSYEKRLQSTADFVKRTSALIEDRKNEELKAENLTREGRSAIIKDSENDINRIKLDGLKENQKLQNETNKAYQSQQAELYKLLTDREKNLIASYDQASTERLGVIEREKNEALTIAAEQYGEGELSTRAYNQRVFDIEAATSAKRNELQIAAVRKTIETQASALAFGLGSAEDLQKSTDALAKLEIEADNAKTKVNREAAIQELHAKELELATSGAELIKSVVQGRYTAELDAISAQSDAIDKQSDRDKAAVDRDLLTSQQKAEKNAIIDAQAQSKKEALADREKEVKRNAAIADRAFNIASIIQNTAVAISKTLAQGGILFSPLTAVIAAIGAAQIATVLATPIPKFRGGVKDFRGGNAIVGDGGSELIETGGRVFLTPPTDTLVSLPTGASVFTHAESMRMLAKPEVRVLPGRGDNGMREVVAAVRDTGKQTVAAMAGRGKSVVNGWLNETKNADRWGRISRNYFR